MGNGAFFGLTASWWRFCRGNARVSRHMTHPSASPRRREAQCLISRSKYQNQGDLSSQRHCSTVTIANKRPTAKPISHTLFCNDVGVHSFKARFLNYSSSWDFFPTTCCPAISQLVHRCKLSRANERLRCRDRSSYKL